MALRRSAASPRHRDRGVLKLRLRAPVHTAACAREGAKRLLVSAAPEAWDGGDAAWREAAVTQTLAQLRVSLEFDGDLRALSEAACEEAFHSFFGATEVRISKDQRWSEAAWRSFCAGLGRQQRLEHFVFWPAPQGVDPAWMDALAAALAQAGGSIEELHLHVLQEYPELFARVTQWLPHMPRLRRLHTPGVAFGREDLDAFKRAFRALLRNHFGVQLREFMAGHGFPDLSGAGLAPWEDILEVRQADLNFAASRVWADPNDGGAWASQTEYFQKRDRQAGILAALRRRELAAQRYFVLYCFLHREVWLGAVKEAPVVFKKQADSAGTRSLEEARRICLKIVFLPPEIRCFVLEFWLGGRIHLGSTRSKVRRRLRPALVPGTYAMPAKGNEVV